MDKSVAKLLHNDMKKFEMDMRNNNKNIDEAIYSV